MIELRPGAILLTSGIGGPAAKWQDRLLSWAILKAECAQQVGFIPTRSHAEILTGYKGETFAARWRTRERRNGLADYIGSEVTIGHRIAPITMEDFIIAWNKAQMSEFYGDFYPIHRIIIQGLSLVVFPELKKFGLASMAMCSEVGAKLFADGFKMPQFAGGWRGWTPADLERLLKFDKDFEIDHEGTLTEEIMIKSGLPTFKNKEDWQRA